MMNISEALRLATAAQSTGDTAKAERIYKTIIKADPQNFDALHLLGVAQAQRGRLQEARRLIVRALEVDSSFAPAHFHLGIVLGGLQRLEEARNSYEAALSIKPDYVEALYNLANVLKELGRPEEALSNYDRALAMKPDYAAALTNRGAVLQELRRREEALASYDAALRIDPGNVVTHVNRGHVLLELERFEEAIASYDRALTIQPRHAEAWSSRGVALAYLLRVDAALESYGRALEIDPAFAEARYNACLCHLLTGDYARGWREHETRWEALRAPRRDFARPLWLGKEDIRGKTLLLHAEQGFGDTIQFCRYAALVKAAGARVVLEVPPPLRRLLESLESVDRVVEIGQQLPPFHFHCPLLSCPLAFGTTVESIPAPPSYLRASPAAAAAWRERLLPFRGIKVGLVWAGESRRHDPQCELIDKRRSMRLSDFAGVAGIPGIVFVSLQKGEPAAQAQEPPAGMTLIDWTAELDDFADTAALIDALDLVIGVDTSVVHLAGALGKPVWVLNRFDTCWRWLLNGDRSPWYPTLRLFRQSSHGDWSGVLVRVAAALEAWRPSAERVAAERAQGRMA